VAGYYASRKRETRPIAFGIAWFFLALVPTALVPLADVANDHRMFFPFVGLALAVFWSARLLLFRHTARLTENLYWLHGAAGCLTVILAVAALGTRERNIVWNNRESLWRDVTVKSPNNSRGWQNYGIAFLSRKDYARALPLLQRAREVGADWPTLDIQLAAAYAGLGRDAEAEQHLRRAIELAPDEAEGHAQYGAWLKTKQRLAEAETQLKVAIRAAPKDIASHYLLMEIYSDQNRVAELDAMYDEVVAITGRDEAGQAIESARKMGKSVLEKEPSRPPQLPAQARTPVPPPAASGQTGTTARPPAGSAETMLRLAAGYCQAGRYEDCLNTSKNVLKLRPEYPEALNVMAMALFATNRGDEGIDALRQALRIKPDYATAQKNLEWALQEKIKAQKKQP
jgi:protein O-mannosyl-transferase